MSTMLYDLKPEYDSLTDLRLEAPELSDDPHELSLELEAIREELNPKLLSLAKVVRTLEAEAGLLEQHSRALLGRASTRRLRVDSPQALDAAADGGRRARAAQGPLRDAVAAEVSGLNRGT
jgi:hypothetical protein